VLVRISGTRPDGRSFDDQQIVLFTLDGVACAPLISLSATRAP